MTKPDVARFSHFWLTDRQATVGLGNVTVLLLRTPGSVEFLTVIFSNVETSIANHVLFPDINISSIPLFFNFT